MAISASILAQLESNPQPTSIPPAETAGTLLTEEAQVALLDGQQPQQQAPATPAQQAPEAPAPQEAPPAPTAEVPQALSETEATELDRLLQAKYGFTQTELDERYAEYTQNQVATAIQEIQTRWGGVDMAEVTRRFQAVQDAYGAILEANPSLDTVDGIDSLYKQLTKQGASLNRPSTSTVQTATAPQYKFTTSQLEGMSEEEYTRRAPEILAALRDNQVRRD